MRKTIMTFAAILAAPMMAQAQSMTAQSVTAKQYVSRAGASDQYELQSSRLVLATSRNPAVRRFAAGMIHDHTQSTAAVKRAAMQSHVVAGPPHLDAVGQRNVAQLTHARGPARDALYIQQQKVSHRMALDVQQGYARGGSAAPLRMAATRIVPVVQHHIGMLDQM